MDFIVRNNTNDPLIIGDLGVVLEPNSQVDLAYIVPVYMIFESNDLYNLINSGYLSRIVEGSPVDPNMAYSDLVIERSDPKVSGSYAKSIALRAESLAGVISSTAHPFRIENSVLGNLLEIRSISYVYIMSHEVNSVSGKSLVVIRVMLTKASGHLVNKVEIVRKSETITYVEFCHCLGFNKNIPTCLVLPVVADLEHGDSVVLYGRGFSSNDSYRYHANTEIVIMGKGVCL